MQLCSERKRSECVETETEGSSYEYYMVDRSVDVTFEMLASRESEFRTAPLTGWKTEHVSNLKFHLNSDQRHEE